MESDVEEAAAQELTAVLDRLRARTLAEGKHVEIGGALVERRALEELFGTEAVEAAFKGEMQ
jgi:hypothetical protein